MKTLMLWIGIADLLINGDPVKRMLRFAAKRARGVGEKAAIGFVFGNLELYGYFGCGSMVAEVVKNEWRLFWQKRKSVTPAMQSSGAPKKNVPSAESSSPNLTKP